ncbi:MAG: substrate-binding domain-containing protein, partial [Brevundimonas sp.]
ADPPTAILASNDQMALAAQAVASGRGLQVPRDLSIVSFDDTPVVRFSRPPMTAVVQPIAEMTRAAADLLIRATANVDHLPTSVVVPFGLAVRGSSAPPRS